ncbi:MAG: hypothetical protein ACRD5Z_19185, partial [Bryobacteraceae bacterium]
MLKKAPAKKAQAKKTRANKTRAKPATANKASPIAASSRKPARAGTARWVFAFGGGKAEGRAGMRDLLGGKG